MSVDVSILNVSILSLLFLACFAWVQRSIGTDSFSVTYIKSLFLRIGIVAIALVFFNSQISVFDLAISFMIGVVAEISLLTFTTRVRGC